MKKTLTFLILFFSVQFLFGNPGDTTILISPQKTGGMPLMEALNKRSSTRDYSENKLSEQQLSDLLWACWGINRKNGKHTAPSSRNKQEIEVYISLENGLYKYIPEGHTLVCILKDDIRDKTGKQDFVNKAAINIIYVANYKKAESNAEDYYSTSCTNVGFMAQNVYLYCASENLGSISRSWFNKKELHQSMKLKDDQQIIICQTVGFKKD